MTILEDVPVTAEDLQVATAIVSGIRNDGVALSPMHQAAQRIARYRMEVEARCINASTGGRSLAELAGATVKASAAVRRACENAAAIRASCERFKGLAFGDGPQPKLQPYQEQIIRGLCDHRDTYTMRPLHHRGEVEVCHDCGMRLGTVKDGQRVQYAGMDVVVHDEQFGDQLDFVVDGKVAGRIVNLGDHQGDADVGLTDAQVIRRDWFGEAVK